MARVTASAMEITALLKAWSGGDATAQERLIPLVYQELRQLAKRYRRRSGAGDTLQTTALVNEAYLRLAGIHNVDWRDRIHFFAVSSQVIRRILVDATRARGAVKRGGETQLIDSLDPDKVAGSYRADDLLAIDDALTRLTELDPRRARVVELRVFGGLTMEESAEILGLSPQSVRRDWKLAKAWLLRELSGDGSHG